MFTRLATTLAVLALLAPPACSAWTWPATGEIIRGFDYGGGAYTASGHRGIDIAGAAGADVLAPAAGASELRRVAAVERPGILDPDYGRLGRHPHAARLADRLGRGRRRGR